MEQTVTIVGATKGRMVCMKCGISSSVMTHAGDRLITVCWHCFARFDISEVRSIAIQYGLLVQQPSQPVKPKGRTAAAVAVFGP